MTDSQEPMAYTPNMRDHDKNPYSKDEQMVADYLNKLTGVGGGDTPISFLILSHASLVSERKRSRFIERILELMDMYDEHQIRFVKNEETGELQPWADCSDCFVWGSADAEEITPENLPLLEQTLAECAALDQNQKPGDGWAKLWALELFAARIRHMRPQGASYCLYPARMWPLFDAVGSERLLGSGNPKPQPTLPRDAELLGVRNAKRRTSYEELKQEIEDVRKELSQYIEMTEGKVTIDGLRELAKKVIEATTHAQTRPERDQDPPYQT